MSEFGVPGHYLRVCISGAVRQGWQADELLRRAGLEPDMLIEANPRVTDRQISRLIRVVWECIDDEHLGLTPQRCPQGTFMLMAERILFCKTLGDMLRESSRFYHILRDDLWVGFEQSNEQAHIILSLRDASLDVDHAMQEFFLLTWQRFSSWLVGHTIEPLVTRFNYSAPAHVSEYPRLFGGELQFDQPCCGYSIDARLLSLPIVRDAGELKAFVAASPGIMFRHLKTAPSTGEQVQKILMREGSGQLPDLQEVARRLSLSPRTLRRRLSDEHSSFQQLKDEVRRDKAVRLLAQERWPIHAVSEALGFSEPAAFCRAFRRWTGCQPSDYRK